MNYFTQKDTHAALAKTHTAAQEQMYQKEIHDCASGTVIYSGIPTKDIQITAYPAGVPEIEVLDMDSVTAIFESVPVMKRKGYTRMGVLNFASYKNPGGMYFQGSFAQEECLCSESYLYNVLSRFEDAYYAKNRTDLNRGMYRNKALYSPRVRFADSDMSEPQLTAFCDVLTCAAPNYSVALRYKTVSHEENLAALHERLRFVLHVFAEQGADCMILGAYGCGVFMQDPTEVAQVFKEEIEYVFHDKKVRIVFAIPGGDNLKAFKNVF